MARIAVGGLHHETNTFAPQLATYERFAEADGWPALSRGEDLLANTAGINLPITGFVDAAHAAGHELVPLVWANAAPSGRTTEDAFERIVGWLLAGLRAALPVDAVFLDLHGAMVTEHLDDGEGELLRRLRQVTGPRVPVVAALDLHANVSAEMVAHSDALVAYRTYPHIDMAETGARCLPVLERLLAGEHLRKAVRRGGFLVGLPWQCTSIEPGRSLYAQAAALEASCGGPVSLAMGFPAADTECCGPTVLAYGDGADAAANALADAYALAEPDFAGRLWAPADAVRHAMNAPPGRPIVLADTQDNPGGGGTGDTTGLLAALIQARAEGAALALLCDGTAAGAAHAAGTGAVLNGFPLGGRHGPAGMAPVVADCQVVRLGDGRFTATGPFYGGNRMDLGPMAALRPLSAPGTTVLVATRRVQAADQAMLRHLGVEPAAQHILALKSSVHFRADFEPLAAEVLVVEAPGLVTADPGRLAFTRLPAELRQSPRSARA
jgi:microcystin degradation protein MlrC